VVFPFSQDPFVRIDDPFFRFYSGLNESCPTIAEWRRGRKGKEKEKKRFPLMKKKGEGNKRSPKSAKLPEPLL